MDESSPAAMTTSLLLHGGWNDSTTSGTPVTSTEKPWWLLPLYIAGTHLWYIYPPFVILFGLFGNAMTIIIMRRMKSGESTINMYFTAIAVVDTIYICTSTVGFWVNVTFGFRIDSVHPVVCKVHTWLYTGGSTVSCWYLVCMTVHRAVSVVWPHRVNLLFTRRTVLLLLAAITVFFAGIYSHYLVGFDVVTRPGTQQKRCMGDVSYEEYTYFSENIFVYIELSSYCVVPFIILILANSVLVWKLTVSVKSASKHLTQGDSDQVLAREKAANSVTLTAIVVSITFLVLTLPSSITYIMDYFSLMHDRISGHERARKVFINDVATLLSHTNSAVNFYLYCLTGRRFREEFLKVLCCGRDRGRRGTP
ncbi:uncharacterized protein LOC143278024 [Babylonia areolata]|uniref:uncharacterized protein LOC143278024 n=1 Tax=Babylonia areolata TaxID=304850 RepID=UPI003FD5B48F